MTVFVNLKSFLFLFFFGFFLHLILVVHDWLCAYIQNNLSGISYVGFRYLSYVFLWVRVCSCCWQMAYTRPFIHLENRPGLHTHLRVFLHHRLKKTSCCNLVYSLSYLYYPSVYAVDFFGLLLLSWVVWLPMLDILFLWPELFVFL